MMVPLVSTPISSSHSIGVMPWRPVISLNSTIDWAAWICIVMPRRSASALLAWMSAGVQVSICDGPIMPDIRPDGCRSAVSISAQALSSPRSPIASSQS